MLRNRHRYYPQIHHKFELHDLTNKITLLHFYTEIHDINSPKCTSSPSPKPIVIRRKLHKITNSTPENLKRQQKKIVFDFYNFFGWKNVDLGSHRKLPKCQNLDAGAYVCEHSEISSRFGGSCLRLLCWKLLASRLTLARLQHEEW